MGRTGINQHITERIAIARRELALLKRFNNLPPKIKSHLCKALIIPVLEYPVIPICDMSKSKIQRIQNKIIKFIANNDPEPLSIEQAHIKYKIDPFNIRMYNRFQKLWNKIEMADPELTQRTREINIENLKIMGGGEG